MNIRIYYQQWEEKQKKSHELLEKAVRQYADEECLLLPENLALTAVENNQKPRFENAEDIYFSISHSGSWWTCAVAREEVGLDIQQEQKCRAERLARRFFHPMEQEWLEKNGYLYFCKMWAYKESYVKYTGVGLTRGMDYFSVISPEGNLTGEKDVCQQSVKFRQDCPMVVTTKEKCRIFLQQLKE